MNKNIIGFILSIFSVCSSANVSVVFSDEVQFKNCDAPPRVPVVSCKDGDKKAIIQLDDSGNLFGFVTEGKASRTFAVKQISKNGNATYYNSLSDKINEETRVMEYDSPVTKLDEYNKTKRALERAIGIAKKSDPNLVDVLMDHYKDLDHEVLKLNSIVIQARNLLWVQSDKNGNSNCEMTTKCPMKKCGENSYVIFDPVRNIYLPISFHRDSRGNAKFSKDDPKIEMVRTLNGAILKYNDEYKRSRLTSSRKAPQNLQHNATAYFSLQDTRFTDYLKKIIPICPESVKEDIISLGFQTNDERKNLDLVHLVEVVNGKINSQYINKNFLPKNSCRDGDSFYTKESYRESKEYRPRSSGVISWKQANELFKKLKKTNSLAWNDITDGSHARAELMVDMLEEEGIIADKAWASGLLKSEKSPKYWSFHVAPVVYVDNGRGQVEKVVLDPATSDSPVSTDLWLKKMGVTEEGLDEVGFPPSLDAVSSGKTTFSIASRNSYYPGDYSYLTKDQKVEASKRLLADIRQRQI